MWPGLVQDTPLVSMGSLMWDIPCLTMVTTLVHLLFHWMVGRAHSAMPVSGRATRLEAYGSTFDSIYQRISARDFQVNPILHPIWTGSLVVKTLRSIFVISNGRPGHQWNSIWMAGDRTRSTRMLWVSRLLLSIVCI
ncbi:hypothetical protein D3C73_739540 [compost metagenome]